MTPPDEQDPANENPNTGHFHMGYPLGPFAGTMKAMSYLDQVSPARKAAILAAGDYSNHVQLDHNVSPSEVLSGVEMLKPYQFTIPDWSFNVFKNAPDRPTIAIIDLPRSDSRLASVENPGAGIDPAYAPWSEVGKGGEWGAKPLYFVVDRIQFSSNSPTSTPPAGQQLAIKPIPFMLMLQQLAGAGTSDGFKRTIQIMFSMSDEAYGIYLGSLPQGFDPGSRAAAVAHWLSMAYSHAYHGGTITLPPPAPTSHEIPRR